MNWWDCTVYLVYHPVGEVVMGCYCCRNPPEDSTSFEGLEVTAAVGWCSLAVSLLHSSDVQGWHGHARLTKCW